jgi:hypothetical protein
VGANSPSWSPDARDDCKRDQSPATASAVHSTDSDQHADFDAAQIRHFPIIACRLNQSQGLVTRYEYHALNFLWPGCTLILSRNS